METIANATTGLNETSTVRQNSFRRTISLLWRKKTTKLARSPPTTNAQSTVTATAQATSANTTTGSANKFHIKKMFHQSSIDQLDETWDDWLERYRIRDSNLSAIPRPLCFSGYGHMVAPTPVDEASRLQILGMIGDRRALRRHKTWLKAEIKKLMARHYISGFAVSTIERTSQFVHCQSGFGRDLKVIARHLSIDSHTILSEGYFCLLDASMDWRTRLNPFVHGPPFLRFYLGIPIEICGQNVGVISLFDPYVRTNITTGLLDGLREISSILSRKILDETGDLQNGNPRIEWCSPTTSFHGDNVDHVDQSSRDTNDGLSESEDEDAGKPPRVFNNGITSSCFEHTYRGVGNSISTILPLNGQATLQPFQILESLLRCHDINHAMIKACRIVSRTLGIEVAYIAEIRLVDNSVDNISSECGVKLQLVAQYTKSFPGTFDFEQETHRDSGGNRESLEPLASRVHSRALFSEYGIKYTASQAVQSFLKTGLMMPFGRNLSNDNKGGFVMGAYSPRYQEFSPGDIAFMKKVIKALANLVRCRKDNGM